MRFAVCLLYAQARNMVFPQITNRAHSQDMKIIRKSNEPGATPITAGWTAITPVSFADYYDTKWTGYRSHARHQ